MPGCSTTITPITFNRLLYDLPATLRSFAGHAWIIWTTTPLSRLRLVGLRTAQRGATASSSIYRAGPLLRRVDVAGEGSTTRPAVARTPHCQPQCAKIRPDPAAAAPSPLSFWLRKTKSSQNAKASVTAAAEDPEAKSPEDPKRRPRTPPLTRRAPSGMLPHLTRQAAAATLFPPSVFPLWKPPFPVRFANRPAGAG